MILGPTIYSSPRRALLPTITPAGGGGKQFFLKKNWKMSRSARNGYRSSFCQCSIECQVRFAYNQAYIPILFVRSFIRSFVRSSVRFCLSRSGCFALALFLTCTRSMNVRRPEAFGISSSSIECLVFEPCPTCFQYVDYWCWCHK